MVRLLVSAALVLHICLMSDAYAQNQLPSGGPAAPAQGGKAGAAPAGEDYMQQVSYALGQNFAEQLKATGIEGLDMKSLFGGITDVLTGAQPKYTDEQLRPTMMRFSQEMRQKMMARANAEGAANLKAAEQFLAQNAKREGVQTTPSGLQFRVVNQGDGPSPTLNDAVKCNYRGTLLDGTEFDSSQAHGGPATFPVQGVIPGWTEALQKMKVGDKWQLFVPPNLAYGADPPGPPIGPNSLLVFEIELLEVLPQ